MVIAANKKVCAAIYLGTVPYGPVLGLQKKLARARAAGKIPDALLLLEHLPVVTVGRFRGEQDMIVPREALAEEGIEVFPTNRGGGITYHGPGQLVGYPILDLRENGLGVREYVGKLEAVIINLLGTFGIEGHRVAEYPGSVWASERKVCSIGIHVSSHITMHGLALNVSNDLRYFEYIRPCGLKGEVMTSLSKLLGRPVAVEDVMENLPRSFSELFGWTWGDDNWLTTLDALSG